MNTTHHIQGQEIQEFIYNTPLIWKIGNTFSFIGINLTQNVTLIIQGKQKKKCLYIKGNQIAYKKTNGDIKQLDYENAYISECFNQNLGSGALLQRGNSNLQIYSLEHQDNEKIFLAMKRFAIQINFQHNYTLEKKIGEGGFAQVYLAKHKYHDKEFGVKIIKKGVMKKEEELLQISKELNILRQLQHTSLSKLYEVYETKQHLCLVEEAYLGGDLYKYLEKHRILTENQTALLIYSLLQPLAALHRQGIFHRDIKPENILFKVKDNLESICLTDFGLADYYKPEGKYLYTRCGTPGYVAPEVLQDKIYDFKVDVFSVGIIMYMTLTGGNPFQADTYSQKVINNYRGKIDFSSVLISNEGLDFIQSILQINPQNRLSVQQALGHQWFTQQQIKAQSLNNRQNAAYGKSLHIIIDSNKQKESPFSSLSSYNSPQSVKTQATRNSVLFTPKNCNSQKKNSSHEVIIIFHEAKSQQKTDDKKSLHSTHLRSQAFRRKTCQQN